MRQAATSTNAINVLTMLSKAQTYFVAQLSQLCKQQKLPAQFTDVQWLRDNGSHGGGLRFEAPQHSIFNQASVNVSQIQYQDRPDKTFISATALSTIIHPTNALVPSVHIHVSWTEMRSGKSYWRLMADLNPAISNQSDTDKFNATLQKISAKYYQQATQQGDQYFYIPTLQTHRGVSHFYLEAFNPEDGEGTQFAEQFINAVINSYIAILDNHLSNSVKPATQAQKQAQLDYHTLYFYQVLTLDRGTTAGLLVHDQNDVGTLGSLPGFVSRDLLIQWAKKTAQPRNKLMLDLIEVLPNTDICEITTEVKTNIAQVIRAHYKIYP